MRIWRNMCIIETELELKKENQINENTYFLDSDISIANSRFETKCHDKLYNFNFKIIRISYKSNNVQNKNVILSSVLRNTLNMQSNN